MTGDRRAKLAALALAIAFVAAAGALLAVTLRPAGRPDTLQERVREVGATLRCPVCQDLSVADSPSGLAREMRAEISDRLRDGWSPDRIRALFVSRYGDWILLSPPARGIGIVVWVAPAVLLLAGLVIAGFAIRRWTVAPAQPPDGPEELSPGDRRLLQRALAAVEEEPE